MLIWLAEYLVQFHTAFNVFSYLTFPRHRRPADLADYRIMDGAACDCVSPENADWQGCPQ